MSLQLAISKRTNLWLVNFALNAIRVKNNRDSTLGSLCITREGGEGGILVLVLEQRFNDGRNKDTCG